MDKHLSKASVVAVCVTDIETENRTPSDLDIDLTKVRRATCVRTRSIALSLPMACAYTKYELQLPRPIPASVYEPEHGLDAKVGDHEFDICHIGYRDAHNEQICLGRTIDTNGKVVFRVIRKHS